MNRRSIPTLLVFTLGPQAESARRGLLPAGQGALERELWDGCLAAALEAGRACGCRLEVCSPAPMALPSGATHILQQDGPFGARLESALLDAFARGTGPVVVVGTDIPGLAARHVERALAALAEDPGRVVLGPSPDGGFYLLACNRPIDGLAGATRWRGRATMRGLIRSLRAAGRSVELLEPLQDLDRAADLERWLAMSAPWESLWRGLARSLDRMFALRRRPPVSARIGRRLPAFAPAAGGRSPPVSRFV